MWTTTGYPGHVYTGPDNFLHRQKLSRFHLAFTWGKRNWTYFFSGPRLHGSEQIFACTKTCTVPPGETGRIFERLSLQVWDLPIFGFQTTTRVLSIMPKIPEISVGIQMEKSVSVFSDRNIRDHLWRWSTYFGWNIPTEICRSIFDKSVLCPN